MIILRSCVVVALLFVAFLSAFGQQKRVAITIDDIPRNGWVADKDAESLMNSDFLRHILQAGTPVGAFFTPGNTLEDDSVLMHSNMLLWIEEPLVTLGNHTMRHRNHAETDRKGFVDDVMIADSIIRSYIVSKPLKYFRFPFNALGKDSADQAMKRGYLTDKGYILTPFTIESSDYAYNAVYANEIRNGNTRRADSIAYAYVEYTIALFNETERFSKELFGRDIAHIFLCHDNLLHVQCYPELIRRLKEQGYTFITLDEALQDPIYQTPNYYHGKAGISWIYRWIADTAKRKEYLRKASDPDMNIYREFQRLSNGK